MAKDAGGSDHISPPHLLWLPFAPLAAPPSSSASLAPLSPLPDPPSPSTTSAQVSSSEIADQPRIEWPRSHEKSRQNYFPTCINKWWYRPRAEIESMLSNRRNKVFHIARIMETDLGVQLFGEDKE
ncbi:hypothetical protein BBP40_001764 [Aspergillus hancockii]|nr:hypothetical protein BBP40_001764 [Aspergillus hancockii]